MNIEQFVAQSEGTWRSMRSGHSLAFQQFEEVLSEVQISRIESSDQEINRTTITLTSDVLRRMLANFANQAIDLLVHEVGDSGVVVVEVVEPAFRITGTLNESLNLGSLR